MKVEFGKKKLNNRGLNLSLFAPFVFHRHALPVTKGAIPICLLYTPD